jgi:hypothetical protein
MISTDRVKPNWPNASEPSPRVRLLTRLLGVYVHNRTFDAYCGIAARPVIGGKSLSVAMPGGAATTAGTALVTGSAV